MQRGEKDWAVQDRCSIANSESLVIEIKECHDM